MRLTNLPAWLSKYGLTVVEVAGWLQRGKPFVSPPWVVLGHHTATSAKAPGNLPTQGILVHGRSDLPGPLCQIGLGRDGTAYVISSGKANHAGHGAWGPVTSSALTVGIEVEHPGTGPWSPVQLDAFDRCAAALLDGLGLSAADYCHHKEWALPKGRKVDVGGVDAPAQRTRLAHLLNDGSAKTATPTPEDDMPLSDEDVQRVAKAAAALVRKDIVTLLRGDATHPYSLESIAKAVGVKP